jgi:hypothetical protein
MGTLRETCETITLNFVLKTGVDELIALGVRTSYRGTKDAKGLQAKYVAQAEEIGRKAFRLDRSDRNGTPLPDSGRLMFGREFANGGAFTFREIVADFDSAGFHLVDVNILREDFRDRLFVNFKREGDSPELQQEAMLAITMLLESWWSNMQGFRNPDGRWNMNVKGKLERTLAEATGDQRIVRMESDGTFRLQKVRQPAAQAPAPTQAEVAMTDGHGPRV